MTRCFLMMLVFVVAGAIAGCGRPHLSHNYGQAYAAWFQAQHVNSKPAAAEQTRRYIEGLDATEASLVSKNYRRSAAGKSGDDAASGGRMLMIGPQRGGGEAYIPPPSVPQGQ
jgi:hypothetical protein